MVGRPKQWGPDFDANHRPISAPPVNSRALSLSHRLWQRLGQRVNKEWTADFDANQSIYECCQSSKYRQITNLWYNSGHMYFLFLMANQRPNIDG